MTTVNLRPFVRPGLDALFVALNAPSQSNANSHWFSGQQSRFYELLYRGGLLVRQVSKRQGDEIVFGSNEANYRGAQYGVADLVISDEAHRSSWSRLVESDRSGGFSLALRPDLRWPARLWPGRFRRE